MKRKPNELNNVKKLSEFQKKFMALLIEQWGNYDNSMKPQGCDFHRVRNDVYQVMVVYMALRHQGNGMKSHYYNLNRNTFRSILDGLNLTPANFTNRPVFTRSPVVEALGL